MAASTVEFEQGDPQVGLLAAVRASKQAEMAEQVHQLHLVIEYCAAHEVEETDTATYVEFGRDTGLALAGPGAPFVSEFAVLELARRARDDPRRLKAVRRPGARGPPRRRGRCRGRCC